MKRVWQTAAKLLAGVVVTAMYAMPQAYTISARPGAINYIEGHAFLDGQPLSSKGLRASFLNTNDTLSTDLGKAEVLLTPGVFLRLGANSQIRMVSPSLTDTQVELKRGEAMIEADGLLKDNNVALLDHGASITLEKNGLYRFTADASPSVRVIDGKAQVLSGNRRMEIGKGHETLLVGDSKQEKFNTKQEDDLYAWSNARSEYDAAASYQAAKTVSLNNSDSWGGFGFGGWSGPGWYWNSAFAGYGWIPGDGAFFSPFGWGFYGMGMLPYAPVIVAPVGGWYNNQWVGAGTRATVPVNPTNPPAVGTIAASPYANSLAQAQTARSIAMTGGLRTATGRPVATGGHFASAGGSGGGHASGFGAMSAGGHVSAASGGGHR